MFKIDWQQVFKQWIKTVGTKLAPIFITAITELFKELMETYNKDNIEKLKDLKEKGDYILQEQKKKLNNEPYDHEIDLGYEV